MDNLINRIAMDKSSMNSLKKYSKIQLIYGLILCLFAISITAVIFMSETKILSVQTIIVSLVCFIISYLAVKKGYNKQMKKYKNKIDKLEKEKITKKIKKQLKKD